MKNMYSAFRPTEFNFLMLRLMAYFISMYFCDDLMNYSFMYWVVTLFFPALKYFTQHWYSGNRKEAAKI